MQDSKTPTQSSVETRYLVMPHQANPAGTVFGGVIVSWIDMTASMAAQKHCGKPVVTASIDSINFRKPINIGDHAILKAAVNYVGKTSMEVGVKVIKEDPCTAQQAIATTAHLTFVGLDGNNKPAPAPQLIPETEDEKRRYKNAQLRVKTRKELLNKLKNTK